jgi:hypothetical protein
MITYIKMRYILVILASCTALIYFLAAHQDAEELTNPDLNSQKRLGTQVEYALFVIVGVGYASMSVWILVGKLNMIIIPVQMKIKKEWGGGVRHSTLLCIIFMQPI